MEGFSASNQNNSSPQKSQAIAQIADMGLLKCNIFSIQSKSLNNFANLSKLVHVCHFCEGVHKVLRMKLVCEGDNKGENIALLIAMEQGHQPLDLC